MKWPLPGRRWLALPAVVWLLASAAGAVAQTTAASGTEAAPAILDATRWRTGLVKLLPGWREHDGDDLTWAQPDFDDSGWKKVDLDDLGPAQPGWRWYRLRVQLAPGHDRLRLLIAGGQGTYEAYFNGLRQEGAQLSWLGTTRPTEQVFSLDSEDTELTIALRTYGNSNYTTWHLPLFLTAAVGTPGGIDDDRLSLESGRLYAAVPAIAINLVVILAGIGAFALFRNQRKHREYLWLGFYLLLLGCSNLLLACSVNGVLPSAWNNLGADPMIYLFTIMQIEFTFSFAGQRMGRGWRLYQLALVLPLAMTASLYAGVVPATAYLIVEALVILPAALILPVLLLVWYRKGNRDAGWLIVPSLLPAATVSLFDLGSVSIFEGWGKLDFLANPIPIGAVQLQLSDLGDLLFVLAIGVVMFFRFTRVSREQTRVAAELGAAREMQQRLVPAQLPEVKGYTIEAAYFPAQEVGGDFYQVLDQGDCTRLVIVGDVSGKGLKAAMTGTLAMGALRALSNAGLGPAAVLMGLNRQLAETAEGGFITCICVRIGEAGALTVANAGHLPPYRNGEELMLDADLPLGIAPEETYTDRVFHLEPGDRLTLLSDGVAEARDASGALFGFDRTRAISTESAEAIAAAARGFGQEDDITVLTLLRN